MTRQNQTRRQGVETRNKKQEIRTINKTKAKFLSPDLVLSSLVLWLHCNCFVVWLHCFVLLLSCLVCDCLLSYLVLSYLILSLLPRACAKTPSFCIWSLLLDIFSFVVDLSSLVRVLIPTSLIPTTHPRPLLVRPKAHPWITLQSTLHLPAPKFAMRWSLSLSWVLV